MTTAQDEYNELFRDKSRRTHHPEDDNESIPSENDDLLSDFDDEPSALPNLPSRDHVPRNKSYSNTGPKGVIADAQAFEAARRERNSSPKAATQNYAYTPNVARLSLDGRSKGSQSGSDIESEDEFMAEWRQKRLNQLSANGRQASNSIGQPRSRATYGGLVSVDGEGYLDAVDRSPSNTVVVVFIYDDSSEVSYMVEDCMRQLARKHKTTRFVKMHYLDAEMEPAGVPAVLAYRGGDKFAGLVPVVDEIPDDADLSAITLENLFQKYVSHDWLFFLFLANLSFLQTPDPMMTQISSSPLNHALLSYRKIHHSLMSRGFPWSCTIKLDITFLLHGFWRFLGICLYHHPSSSICALDSRTVHMFVYHSLDLVLATSMTGRVERLSYHPHFRDERRLGPW
ncbi:unnamed protein product [Aureobasidium vineae]|uniref:Phosducin domain-containing protein n=1 Tax=Aureobasidium vineae TaxID=2773715 RepID=A0A9N8P549_9PEZI|nr:unnamed protein product [Aureobasidium vineae]